MTFSDKSLACRDVFHLYDPSTYGQISPTIYINEAIERLPCKYFTALAQSINGEKPILAYQPDTAKFPMTITELSGSSTGTRKSLIAAFDLAYQLFAIENHIHTPGFVVHDACESVEGEDLHTIIDAANCIEAQYIVAVLKEKLDSSGIPDQEQRLLQILQLAEDDKLF